MVGPLGAGLRVSVGESQRCKEIVVDGVTGGWS